MLARLLNFSRQRMVQNALALYGVTIANALIPLMLIPYLARVLKPGAWGMVLFAQVTSNWIAMVVEYGFSYSATREIARHVDQPEKIRQIVAEMMGGKAILCLSACLAAAVLWFAIPEFKANPLLLIAALWSGLAQGLSPLSYFQGVERLRLPAALSVACRLLFAGSVFLFIKSPADAPMVVIYQAMSMTLSLSIQFVLMYRETQATLCKPSRAWTALLEAWPFFLFVAIVQSYANANSFLLGLVATSTAVSFYGGPERLMRGILSLTGPVNQVLYPRLTYLVKHDYPAARRTVRSGTLMVAGIGLVLGLSLSLAAPWFVSLLFGTGYEGAVPVLRVIGLVCPFASVSSVLGVRWMFPLGMERLYNRITMSAAILDVLLALFLVQKLQALGVAIAVLVAEVFITTTVFIVLWKRQLNPFQQASQREALEIA